MAKTIKLYRIESNGRRLAFSADRTRAVPIGSPVQSQMADSQANGNCRSLAD
jgi:hypothetical protein